MKPIHQHTKQQKLQMIIKTRIILVHQQNAPAQLFSHIQK